MYIYIYTLHIYMYTLSVTFFKHPFHHRFKKTAWANRTCAALEDSKPPKFMEGNQRDAIGNTMVNISKYL